MNVHNDPCFEDKSSSLTLKYCPVHFSETAVCILKFPGPKGPICEGACQSQQLTGDKDEGVTQNMTPIRPRKILTGLG